MRESPFPGMAPYLEEPSLWGGVHTRLTTAIADDLAEQLAPYFVVGLEERVYSVERRERFVEVRDRASRRVIVTIEVLSPVNKTPGDEGAERFLSRHHRACARLTPPGPRPAFGAGGWAARTNDDSDEAGRRI